MMIRTFQWILIALVFGIIAFGCKSEISSAPVENGIAKIYYENGNIRRLTTMKNGKKNGTEKVFYPNGKLEMECINSENKVIGSQIFYYPNGKPWVYNLIDGNSNGVFKRRYSEEGKIYSNDGVPAILVSNQDFNNFRLDDKLMCALVCANPPDSKTHVKFEITREKPVIIYDDWLVMDSSGIRPIEIQFEDEGIKELLVIGRIEDSIRNTEFTDTMFYSLRVSKGS